MANGISYLINLLSSSSARIQECIYRQFTVALRVGVKVEPENFPNLIEEYSRRMNRAYPDWSYQQVKSRTLENIATYCVLADHDFETEMVPRAIISNGKKLNISDYLDDPNKYGRAMNTLADYFGVKGPELRKFLLELQFIH